MARDRLLWFALSAAAVALAVGAQAVAKGDALTGEYPQHRDIVDPREVAKVRSEFQSALRGLGSREAIRSCPVLVEVLGHGSRIDVHAGICDVSRGGAPKLLLMCDEHGIGGFAVTTSFPMDADGAQRFAWKACLEGAWEPVEDPGPVGNTAF